MQRCFVISPIGPEGSETREHANDVFDYIIKPAMEECGIQAFRSDHLQEPGKITEQMFREILTDDLVIAVLTGHNANVFYELAIAHAASRPAIVLIEKAQTLPFDISDLRCVSYDLKPRSLFEKVYVKEVVAHVGAFQANGWKVPDLFGSNVFQLGDRSPRSAGSFFCDSSEFGTPASWLDLLSQTEHVFETMGVHLSPWRGNKGFSELVIRKAEEGCRIRIQLMHPDNPALTEMINEDLTDTILDDVTREIDEMSRYFARLATKNPSVMVQQIRRGSLHCQTTRVDTHVMYVPYLYTRRRRYCPLWKCKAGSPLYSMITEEFEGLWRANESRAAATAAATSVNS